MVYTSGQTLSPFRVRHLHSRSADRNHRVRLRRPGPGPKLNGDTSALSRRAVKRGLFAQHKITTIVTRSR